MGVGVGWCVGQGRWDTLAAGRGAAELKKRTLNGVVCILLVLLTETPYLDLSVRERRFIDSSRRAFCRLYI